MRKANRLALCVMGLMWLVSRDAQAQTVMPAPPERGVLRAGTRPWWFALSLGPTVPIVANALTFGPEIRFNLSIGFGYHFTGRSSGPAIGAEVHQFFLFNPGGYMIEALASFRWDFQLGMTGVYLAPTLGAGFAVLDGNPVGTLAGPDFRVGLEMRFVLGDRGVLFVRPIEIDLPVLFSRPVPGPVTLVNYDFLIGGGVTF